ncbi:MAG: hypothetical protein F6K63_35095 [Moorea sp. SIO1G6]|uniref:hypothetical protein n=1 Tax=unclassified Moorena TaxID=2683338 RepID=UPI0013BC52FD|nr:MULTISPECIES: hypothetical protein [unclassified Moorena]NEQ10572.1 hypothetical protein [Moorena sp. SIO4E2]NEQ13051.1 hypothetical protein [Moorena sp. SIO3E2]NES83594.1 hypothetical protein [Moorena sp. SIO2B7]NET69334.1 hypothetical protein [Moorena sp. SIO1G6]
MLKLFLHDSLAASAGIGSVVGSIIGSAAGAGTGSVTVSVTISVTGSAIGSTAGAVTDSKSFPNSAKKVPLNSLLILNPVPIPPLSA